MIDGKNIETPALKQKKRSFHKSVCEYKKDKHNIISGCGIRANYNRSWKFCPYCGKRIINLSGSDKE